MSSLGSSAFYYGPRGNSILSHLLVEIAGYRALAQMGNQVGSLACLVFVMVDMAPVAASTATLVENGALPHCCELTTCRAHLN